MFFALFEKKHAMAIEKIDIMNELLKVALEFIRKQAGMVVILLVACVGLAWLALEQKKELVAQMKTASDESKAALAHVSARLDACEEARSRLVVEVEVLKVRVEVLSKRR